MTPENYQRIKRVFQGALERDPAERDDFLAKACEGDETLRRDVEEFLGCLAGDAGFLEGEVVPRGLLGRILDDVDDLSSQEGVPIQSEMTLEGERRGQGESSSPEVSEPSILVSLGSEGEDLGRGVALRDLEEDDPLPEMHVGPEKYRILRELGRGGMGTVYLAYDQDLNRRVALKMMRFAGPEAKRRFLEETQVLAQLQHPAIVPIHEVGLTKKGSLYYTMPIVAGRTLASILDNLRSGVDRFQERYSLAALMQIFVQVAQAVSYAHMKGVVHRDLKPSNVMVGRHGEVQVIDWGLSKILESASVRSDLRQSTSSDGSLGTPAYMSPEQVRGGEVDERADVYSLGVILYELLTLKLPFEGEQLQVLMAHVKQEPRAPRRRCPERRIPLELEGICLTALRKRPADRHSDSGSIMDAVRAWLEAESDKAKRRRRAEAMAKNMGRARLVDDRRLEEEVGRLETQTTGVRGGLAAWQSVEGKGALIYFEDAVRAAREQSLDAAARVVETLERSLKCQDDLASARETLADYYWDRFLEAESREDRTAKKFFATRVRHYHDGKYARELRGDGSD